MKVFRLRQVGAVGAALSLLVSVAWTPATAFAVGGGETLQGASPIAAVQPPAGIATGEEAPPRLLQGKLSGAIRSEAELFAYMESNPNVFGFDAPRDELEVVKVDGDAQGKQHYLLQQYYEGVPVYGMYMRAHTGTDRRLYAITNDTQPALNGLALDTNPVLDGQQAGAALQASVEAAIGSAITLGGRIGPREIGQPKAELIVYPWRDSYVLAYRVQLEYAQPTIGRWTGFVDATTGEVLKKFSYMAKAFGYGNGYYGEQRSFPVTLQEDNRYYLLDKSKSMYREESGDGVIATYDWENPFFPVSSNSSSFNDPEAVDAHYYAGEVYDFYKERFGRESLDGRGSSIISVVNAGPIDNAYWDGSQIVYGDGNSLFECLTCGKDVIAHELTHAVTEFTANLEYVGQSGALNESISDMMAAVFDADDWMIGEDLNIKEGHGVLRDMKTPARGLDPQPATMADYVSLPEDEAHDNGGVHINSGIPNRAAYLIATEIDRIPGLEGQGRNLLGQIVYGALTAYLTPTSGFEEARDAFVLAAGDLELSESARNAVALAVQNGWTSVGLGYTSAENDIVSFSAAGMTGFPAINKLAHTVTFEAKFGTDLTSLMPAMRVSPGATVTPGTDQAQDFTKLVTYTVTSSNGQSQVWTVQGTVAAPQSEADIVDFQTVVQTGASIIDPIARTVKVYVEADDKIDSLAPQIGVSPGATVTPSSGVYRNFNQSVGYTVTAQDGTTRQWSVTVIKDSGSPKLVASASLGDTSVGLLFDKPMSLSSLGNLSNYGVASLRGDIENPRIVKVEIDCTDPRIVYLTTTALASQNAYQISVSNVKSVNGHDVRPDWSTSYFLTDDTMAPMLSTARVDGDRFALTFNEYVRVPIAAVTYVSIYVNGTKRTITETRQTGRKVAFTLDKATEPGDDVQFSYLPPAGSGAYLADLSGNQVPPIRQTKAINRSGTAAPVAAENWLHVNGQLKQTIMHPTEPILYAIQGDRSVLLANLETGRTATATLALQPERLYFANGKLYVALITAPHSSYWWEEEQNGFIAVLHPETLKQEDWFEIDIDPYDIAVDANNVLYVSSGSGQWTNLSSYSLATHAKIQSASIRQASYLQLSPAMSRLYAVNTDSIPRDISAYNIDSAGKISGEVDSPYHGDYPLSTLLRVTPDGKYLLNGAGTVFMTNADVQRDMRFSRTIAKFEEAAFPRGTYFYTIDGRTMRQYEYETLDLHQTFVLPMKAESILAGNKENELLIRYAEGNGTTVVKISVPREETLSSGATVQGLRAAAQAVAGAASASVQLNACPVTPPPTGGGGSVGGGGGGGGVPPIMIPPPVVPPAESGETTIGSSSVQLGSEDLTSKEATDAQGRTETSVTPDSGKLLDAVRTAQAGFEQAQKNGTASGNPTVVLPVAAFKDGVNVQVATSTLQAAQLASPNGILAVQTESAVYRVPVRLFGEQALRLAHGNNAVTSDSTTTLTIETLDSKLDQQVQSQLTGEGFRPVTASLNFGIRVESGGTSKEITDFNGVYVTRSFVLPATADAARVSAMVYDPDAKQLLFIPSSVRTESGKQLLDVKSPHNSIYTVVQGAKTFEDVKQHWAKADIELLASKKVMQGTGSVAFDPNRAITRAEFASTLVRSLGLQATVKGSRFSDVADSAWYAGAVNAAAGAGLVTGGADERFRPDGQITRQEMAAMLARAVQYAGQEQLLGDQASSKSVLSGFADAKSIAAWAQEDVAHLVAGGIMQGISATRFDPTAPVSRAQTASALKRILQKLAFI
ncbi:M4 family metallopeptidase [Paenibacillus methanolicus]|uniref:Zn-dependent metalloprotease n=1 Tax=Paenibacillus methanolicus TaxID=582686 RepID=A0A5S5BP82_9BACL|nr:M4 family metallopeptidase [Paenibacillus methanolicus]TYP68098.1 Zn-dependent metalloprotease [Paenibacillus methanolicus]